MAESEPVAVSAAAPPIAPFIIEARPHAKLIGLLALGHFVIDLNQGALPAVLPVLKGSLGLTYAATATIVLISNVASSIVQPLFGYLADRTARRWMLPLAVALSGAGVALLGIAPSYLSVLLFVGIMGIGVAAYHPEGYRTATSLAGEHHKATAIAWFAFGGNTGIALGPALLTALVAVFGVGGSLGMLGPAAVVTALLLGALPRIGEASRRAAAATVARPGVTMPRAMALLVVVVMIRSWTSLGFTTFVPLYYIDHLGADPTIVGPLLFVFLGAGALGTVVAAPLADRWGIRRFMLWGFLAVTPLAVLFLTTRGIVAFVLFGVIGATLVSTFTMSMVLAQQYLPRRAGMASGLLVGFASGAGAVGVTALGWVADHWSLQTSLWVSALMPIVGSALTAFLPEPRREP